MPGDAARAEPPSVHTARSAFIVRDGLRETQPHARDPPRSIIAPQNRAQAPPRMRTAHHARNAKGRPPDDATPARTAPTNGAPAASGP